MAVSSGLSDRKADQSVGKRNTKAFPEIKGGTTGWRMSGSAVGMCVLSSDSLWDFVDFI